MSKVEVPQTAGSLANRSMEFFVSYSRQDLQITDEIVTELKGVGFSVKIDRRDLPFGREWQDELTELIRSADTVIVLVSKEYLQSKSCAWELQEAENLNKRLVPLALEKLDYNSLPEEVSRFQFLPAEGAFSFSEHFEMLVATLHANSGWLKLHSHLGNLAHQWHQNGRHRDGFLRGSVLEKAEDWRDVPPQQAPLPPPHSLDFISSSRKGRERQQKFALAGALAVATIAITLGTFAFLQKRLAEQRLEEAAFTTNMVVVGLVSRLKNSGMPLEYARETISLGQSLLDRVSPDETDNEELIWSRSTAFQSLGDIHMRTKNYKQARKVYSDALTIRRRIYEKNPDAIDIVPNITASMDGIAQASVQLGDLVGADKIYDEITSMRRKLTVDSTRKLEARRLLASALTRSSSVAVSLEKNEKAVLLQEEAEGILRQVIVSEPQIPVYRIDLASLLIEKYKLNKEKAGLSTVIEAAALLRKLTKELPDNASLATRLSQTLANIAVASEQPDRGRYFVEGKAIVDQLLKEKRLPDHAKIIQKWYTQYADRFKSLAAD